MICAPMNNQPYIRTLFFAASLLGLLGILFLVPISRSSLPKSRDLPASLASATTPVDNRVSEPPRIRAASALVYDITEDAILFEKNPHASHGIASITKIMTAVVALTHAGPDEIVTISEEAVRMEGAQGNLFIREQMPLRKLISLMMMLSSNDAAAAIAEHAGRIEGVASFEESQTTFTRLMNEKARLLGLSRSTYFRNPTGLDLNETAGMVSNTSTAADLARLITITLQEFPSIWSFEEKNRDAFTHSILREEAGVIGGKTGFTDSSGGSLVTIAQVPLGKLVVIIVLSSTYEGRFEDTRLLLQWLRG